LEVEVWGSGKRKKEKQGGHLFDEREKKQRKKREREEKISERMEKKGERKDFPKKVKTEIQKKREKKKNTEYLYCKGRKVARRNPISR